MMVNEWEDGMGQLPSTAAVRRRGQIIIIMSNNIIIIVGHDWR